MTADDALLYDNAMLLMQMRLWPEAEKREREIIDGLLYYSFIPLDWITSLRKKIK